MKHMDYIYLQENYYKDKKEMFNFLIDLLKNRLSKKSIDGYSLLDLGCSRGELLYHIKNDLKNYISLVGLDYSQHLIDSAKSQDFLNDVHFVVGDAENFNLSQQFDFIVCSGLTGYFDSLKNLFSNIEVHLAEGGNAFVFHIFNKLDVDVLVKYRNNKHFDEFQPGWNVHSISTARKELENTGLKLMNTHEFQLSYNDEMKEDPARSWTGILDGKKKFVNGLGQIYDLICLEIKKIN
jgi:SAM-dependent methyltransferase